MSEALDSLAAFSEEDVLDAVLNALRWVREPEPHQEFPKAVLFAGQPGAGKSVLSSSFYESFNHNVVFVNADEYRRMHPAYAKITQLAGTDSVSYTGAFSGAVTEHLVDYLSQQKYHLLIEGTGRTVGVPKKTATLLCSRGYSVEMAVIAVRPELSLCSTLLRYYSMREDGTIPRATAVEAHDRVVDVLPSNLDILRQEPVIQKISLWNRDSECIYDSGLDSTPPSEALRHEWNRPWKKEEIHFLTKNVELLKQKELAEPGGLMSAIEELDRRVQAVALQYKRDKRRSDPMR